MTTRSTPSRRFYPGRSCVCVGIISHLFGETNLLRTCLPSIHFGCVRPYHSEGRVSDFSPITHRQGPNFINRECPRPRVPLINALSPKNHAVSQKSQSNTTVLRGSPFKNTTLFLQTQIFTLQRLPNILLLELHHRLLLLHRRDPRRPQRVTHTLHYQPLIPTVQGFATRCRSLTPALESIP